MVFVLFLRCSIFMIPCWIVLIVICPVVSSNFTFSFCLVRVLCFVFCVPCLVSSRFLTLPLGLQFIAFSVRRLWILCMMIMIHSDMIYCFRMSVYVTNAFHIHIHASHLPISWSHRTPHPDMLYLHNCSCCNHPHTQTHIRTHSKFHFTSHFHAIR